LLEALHVSHNGKLAEMATHFWRTPMNSLAPYLRLAEYNRWINDKLYALCAELDDSVRKRPGGAFFGSVHGTLNHLLLADRVWLGRFTGAPFAVATLADELYADFAELALERRRTDAAIIDYVAGLSPERLDTLFSYTSVATRSERCYR